MRSCCEGKRAARTPNIRLRKHDITVEQPASLYLSATAHARLVPLTYGTGTQLVVYIDIVGGVIMLSDGDADPYTCVLVLETSGLALGAWPMLGPRCYNL